MSTPGRVIDLPEPSLSRMLVAETDIGKMLTSKGIAEVVAEVRGCAPDGDLIIAACRRYASLQQLPGLQFFCDYLDDSLTTD